MKTMQTRRITISLCIGALAGAIDIIPGLVQGVDYRITLADFTFWVGVGFVVAHVSLPVKNWVKGFAVAMVLAIPGAILLSLIDPHSVLPMFIIAALLGPAVGYLTGRFLGEDQRR